MFDATVNNVAEQTFKFNCSPSSELQFSASAFDNNNSHTEYVLKPE